MGSSISRSSVTAGAPCAPSGRPCDGCGDRDQEGGADDRPPTYHEELLRSRSSDYSRRRRRNPGRIVLESLLADVHFALRWLQKEPRVHPRGRGLAGHRHRLQHRALRRSSTRCCSARCPWRTPIASWTCTRTRRATRFASARRRIPDYLDLKAQNDVFDDTIAYSPMFGALNLGERSRLALGEIVTGNYFQMLGVGAAARAHAPARRTTARRAARGDDLAIATGRASSAAAPTSSGAR